MKVQTQSFTYKIENGKIYLSSEYNPKLVSESRAFGRWDGVRRQWWFDERDLERFKNMLTDVFGTDGDTAPDLVDIYLDLDELPNRAYSYALGESIFIAGRQIAIRKSRDYRVQLGENVSIIEGGFPSSGGSAKHPRLDAKNGTILRLRDVPKSLLEKEEMWCNGCFFTEIKAKKSQPDIEPLKTQPELVLEVTQKMEETGKPIVVVSKPAISESMGDIKVTVYEPEQTRKNADTENDTLLNALEVAVQQPSAEKSEDEQEEQAEDATAGLMPYQPMSKAPSFEVLIPKTMGYEVRQSLLRVRSHVKDIDWYVARKLKYEDKNELFRYFAAEQIDALALAIYNSENKEGIIVGDQTGIGKGRIAAGMVRYAVKNGYPAIFFTIQSRLFSDLYRDLMDIGSAELVPLIINTGDPDAVISVDLDAENRVKWHEYKNDSRYKPKSFEEFERLVLDRDTMPPGYDFVMCTYSQVTQDFPSKQAVLKRLGSNKKVEKPQKSQFKCDFLSNIAPGAVVIMDEAHMAAGGESTTGEFFKSRLLDRASGCLYLSATFAKRADNMPVFALKTAMSHTGLTPDQFETAFENGGVALQEIVASELARSGQMVRRQRSMEGISFHYVYLEQEYERHRAIYDTIARLMQSIGQFEEKVVKPIVQRVSDQVKNKLAGKASEKGIGTKRNEFFSSAHNLIRQVFFSLKAKDVAEGAIELLKQDKKVVIAFSRTMEGMMKEYAYTAGDIIPPEKLKFNDIFKRIFEKTLQYSVSYTLIENEGTPQEIQEQVVKEYLITEDDLGGPELAAYIGIQDDMALMDLDLSISPIDVLINTIQQYRKPVGLGGHDGDYFVVKECTGRSFQITQSEPDSEMVYTPYRAKVAEAFSQFNRGDADVLLINQSAATGVSAHSSAKFKDRRQRAMIIHEPELDINIEVQKWGRINRTGQVNLPEYYYYSTSVAGERRLFMVMKGKIRSLDANTTGSQKTSESVTDAADFFNKYGDKAVRAWLDNNADEAKKIGLTKKQLEEAEENNFRSTKSGKNLDDDLAAKLARRIAFAETEVQREAYETITADYLSLINEAKMAGTYDLETEYLDLQAETKSRTIYQRGSGKASPFGRSAVFDLVSARVLKRPMPFIQVQENIKKGLNGQSPADYMQAIVEDFREGRKEYESAKLFSLQKRIWEVNAQKEIRENEKQEREAEYQILQIKPVSADEKVAQKDAVELSKAAKRVETAEASLFNSTKKLEELRGELYNAEAKLTAETNNALNYLTYFYPGQPFVYKSVGSITGATHEYRSIVLGVSFVKPKGDINRYSLANVQINLALYHPERLRVMKLNDAALAQSVNHTKFVPRPYMEDVFYNWNRMNSGSGKREDRGIINNNILLAIGRNPDGRLVRYTNKEGAIKNGILLNKREGSSTQADNKQKIAAPIREALPFLKTVTGRELAAQHEKFGMSDISFMSLTDGSIRLKVTSKRNGQFIWGNDDLLALIEQAEADKRAGIEPAFTRFDPRTFSADFDIEKAVKVLEILSDLGVYYETDAPEYVESDDTPLPDIEEEVTALYRYEQSNNSNQPPIDGLLGDIKVENGAKVFEYTRELTEKELLQNGMIPYFANAHESAALWYDRTKGTEKALNVSQELSYEASIEQIRRHLAANRTRLGNREFEFGNYDYRSLSIALYEIIKGQTMAQQSFDLFKKQLNLA